MSALVPQRAAAQRCDDATAPWVEVVVTGEAWLVDAQALILGDLRARLHPEGIAACVPDDESGGAPVAVLHAEAAGSAVTMRLEEGLEPFARTIEFDQPLDARPLAVAASLFDALRSERAELRAALGLLPLDAEGQPIAPEEHPPLALGVALWGGVHGYLDGLTEPEFGARALLGLWQRGWVALGLDAGRALDPELAAGPLSVWRVALELEAGAALTPWQSRVGVGLFAQVRGSALFYDPGEGDDLSARTGYALYLYGGLSAWILAAEFGEGSQLRVETRFTAGGGAVQSAVVDAGGQAVTGARGVALGGSLGLQLWL